MNARLGEWILGEMLALESKILDGEPSSIEPIGILNASHATQSDAPAMSVDDLVALFNEFPARPDWRPHYRPFADLAFQVEHRLVDHLVNSLPSS